MPADFGKCNTFKQGFANRDTQWLDDVFRVHFQYTYLSHVMCRGRGLPPAGLGKPTMRNVTFFLKWLCSRRVGLADRDRLAAGNQMQESGGDRRSSLHIYTVFF